MFPNILYNYSVIYLLNLININTSRKKLWFYVKYCTKIKPIIKILKQFGYIEDYILIKIKDKYFFKITPFYFKNYNVIKNFKLISTPTKKYFISIKALYLLNKRCGNSIYIISTSKGIHSHHSALKKNLSGFILGFLYN